MFKLSGNNDLSFMYDSVLLSKELTTICIQYSSQYRWFDNDIEYEVISRSCEVINM